MKMTAAAVLSLLVHFTATAPLPTVADQSADKLNPGALQAINDDDTTIFFETANSFHSKIRRSDLRPDGNQVGVRQPIHLRRLITLPILHVPNQVEVKDTDENIAELSGVPVPGYDKTWPSSKVGLDSIISTGGVAEVTADDDSVGFGRKVHNFYGPLNDKLGISKHSEGPEQEGSFPCSEWLRVSMAGWPFFGNKKYEDCAAKELGNPVKLAARDDIDSVDTSSRAFDCEKHSGNPLHSLVSLFRAVGCSKR
ncbi:hypothetical protein B0T11DRAFT_63941 [Plectosphaerella cucumerina]|uniref:Uncharacterized protein n=1 Tax=Plectosphaerella cucumerina TaxID=40658 RepID=A0A8K0X7X7_9PEZI|nr:hypothetical protein B0T11DRAFT_63941 [Plectosphaerella cucumerina]